MSKTANNCFKTISLVCLSLAMAGCGEASSASESSSGEKKMISFLGDSITYGMGASARGSTSYVGLIGKELDNVTTRNLGAIGSTIATVEDNMSFVHRYTSINEDSSIIFVLGGTNDYGNEPCVPLGELGDDSETTFYGALNIMMNGLTTGYSNSKIIFATPMQRDDAIWGSPETTPYNSLGLALEDYRDAIVDMCDRYGIEYVDFYNTEGFRLSDENFHDNFDDGLHPNDNGHKLAADILIEVFEKYL